MSDHIVCNCAECKTDKTNYERGYLDGIAYAQRTGKWQGPFVFTASGTAEDGGTGRPSNAVVARPSGASGATPSGATSAAGSNAPSKEEGRKLDKGKDPWHLLPWGAVRGIVKVLQHGAEKYAPNNWKHVPDWRSRYFSAMQRHLSAWFYDEEVRDPESGMHHLWHAGCCLLFLIAKDESEAKP